MSNGIGENSYRILSFLFSLPRREGTGRSATGPEIADSTGLSPDELNDAVTVLHESGLIDWLQTFGTAPYAFREVEMTPRGRYEFERTSEELSEIGKGGRSIARPPTPIGSPFGFNDYDWEFVAQRRGRKGILLVVMGYQFESDYYGSDKLKLNVKEMISQAINQYNALPGAIHVDLEFQPLAAGYGEHLFNEIARDIISADIAIFETSDLNPNVMLEMGVALTWGVRILPIKVADRPKPPSDISGQTWADYSDSAEVFTDTDHMDKLVRMIERATRKKAAI